MRHENVNGAILDTDSKIKVGRIDLSLSFLDAWALCNMLDSRFLEENRGMLLPKQIEALKRIGRDVGIFIDHPTRHNMGKFRLMVDQDHDEG